MSQSKEAKIPCVLWNYWENDDNGPPPIVELCRKSWVGAGKFADVRIVTPKNVSEFLRSEELPKFFHDMPPVNKADAVRIALLAKYGGYWADAGILTTGPIDAWVFPKASKLGFFVFQDVDRSRVLDNWFISGTPESPFIQEWGTRFRLFFDKPRIHGAHSLKKTPSRIATHLIVAINKKLRSSPSRIGAWAKFPLSSLPMYPYFIMHYIANAMLDTPGLRDEFESMEKVKASRALALRGLLDKHTLTYDAAAAISSDVPIHKLNTYRTYSPEELQILESLIC